MSEHMVAKYMVLFGGRAMTDDELLGFSRQYKREAMKDKTRAKRIT